METIVKQVAKHYQVKSVDIRRRGANGNLPRDESRHTGDQDRDIE